jgi:hypothetical protein
MARDEQVSPRRLEETLFTDHDSSMVRALPLFVSGSAISLMLAAFVFGQEVPT